MLNDQPLSPDGPTKCFRKKSVVMRNVVECKNVVFAYQSKVILNNVTLTLKQGKITALLGSSGCGKTTLLRNILGRLKPESGTVRVFGKAPGSTRSNIPGPGAGFMPQDYALDNELTIGETLNFFGKIYHMKFVVIEKRIDFLLLLLNLPNKTRKVSELSGGQKRRVSIAVTLLHQPPLLVLDEPTVGVDLLLRQVIWNYLHQLVDIENVTVIITTHYIEEAQSAGSVALMRFGRILIQDQPDNLMSRYNCNNLESVFFVLCEKDDVAIRKRMSMKIEERKNSDKIEMLTRRRLTKKTIQMKHRDVSQFVESQPEKHFDPIRIGALLTKNLLTLSKKRFNLLSFYILPLIALSLMAVLMGRPMKHLPVSIVNNEVVADLSSEYLKYLNPSIFEQTLFAAKEEAVSQVKIGKSLLAMTFAENFSYALDIRFRNPSDADDQVIKDSSINVTIDMTNSIVGLFSQNWLMNFYRKFAVEYLSKEHNYNRGAVDIPIVEQEFIYGQSILDNPNGFNDYFVVGTVTLIVNGFLLIIGAFSITADRQSGLIERCFVAGVRPTEIVVTHLIIALFLISSEVILVFIWIFHIFQVSMSGTVLNVLSLLLAIGFEGFAIGMLISVISPSLSFAFCLSVMLFMVFFFVSGIVWPLEAISPTIKVFIQMLPLTWPASAFHSVVLRGWTIYHLPVLIGYFISLFYSVLFIALTLIAFRFSIFTV